MTIPDPTASPRPTTDRRTFLRRAGLAGAAGTAAALVPGVARPQPAPDDCLAPFLHGVASGDPTADGVVLWTRVTPDDPAATVPVSWVVATDVDLTAVVASGTVDATPTRDHTVKVDVGGLAPGRHHFYAFAAGGVASVVGRTKTAPAGDPGRLRFGVASCSSYQHGFFNGYARLADRDDLDAILHLGDYVYEYAPGTYGDLRAHEPPVEMTTLAEYRGRHAFYKLDPDLRRLHQLHPFVTTWDDHESTDNSWRDGANNHTEGPEGVWAERKAWAQQAYDEWMPIRSESPDRIYRTLRYGDLCDLIVLDTRLEGRDEQVGLLADTIVNGAEIDDPDRRLVSPAQMAWFQDELSASQARGTAWRIVCQQVCVGQWNLPGLPDAIVGVELPDVPQLGLRDDGNGLNPDSWDGYTADRERFLGHVRDQGIDDLVVLTGDVHSSWAMELTTNPADLPTYTSLGVEFVAPGITSPGFGDVFGPFSPLFVETIRNPLTNPHIKYLEVDSNGYLVLDVTAAGVQCDWYFVDSVLAPSDGEVAGASWRVARGANTLVDVGTPLPSGPPAPAVPAPDPAACVAGQPAPQPTTPTTADPTGGNAGPGTLPATGGGVGGWPLATVVGAAGLAEVLRRRARAAGR